MEYVVLGLLIGATVLFAIWLIRRKQTATAKAILLSAVALVCSVALVIGGSFGVRALASIHDHQVVMVEKVLPTCTEAGYIVYDCAGCDENDYIGVIAKKPHRLSEWAITKDPTCAEGEECASCLDCGYITKKPIPAVADHDMSAWETVIPATCANEGLMQSHCKACGFVKEYTLPMKPCTW